MWWIRPLALIHPTSLGSLGQGRPRVLVIELAEPVIKWRGLGIVSKPFYLRVSTNIDRVPEEVLQAAVSKSAVCTNTMLTACQ